MRYTDIAAVPPHRTIVMDPPWTPALHANNPRRATLDKSGPQKHYPTLSLVEIMNIRPPMADQCHVYIWGLSQHLDWPYRCAQVWGLEPVITLTWRKPGLGTGRFQCNTEHVLLCRRGPKKENGFGQNIKNYEAATKGTCFDWPRGRHSEKPSEFFTLVEDLSPGPYLEMYARKERLGWSAFGNEL